ncbi:MAG: hypothetical protein CYPHOPRED_004862 [Cyphobasidiales sp. Tagirdzhanova-0007]|nr:MAG: hypothetical protein CYPHOPRED_004862 [Cyphobasidiales sp. Tagirdzhanova-0007]
MEQEPSPDDYEENQGGMDPYMPPSGMGSSGGGGGGMFSWMMLLRKLMSVWFSSSTLNHHIGTVSYIAGIAMFITGAIGLLFSIMFMSRLRAASASGDPIEAGGTGAAPVDNYY